MDRAKGGLIYTLYIHRKPRLGAEGISPHIQWNHVSFFFPAGLLEFMGQQWPSLRGDYTAIGLQNFCNALIFRDLCPGTNCNARLHGLGYKEPYGMATCRQGNIHSDSCDFLQHFETDSFPYLG